MSDIKESSGAMFHTNTVSVKRRYTCDYDCEQSGCPGHIGELKINNTAGVAEWLIDGKSTHWFGCNDAQALFDMMKQLQDE